MGNACEFLDIEYGTAGIADGFAKHRSGIGTESLLYFLFAIVGIDKGTFNTQFLQGDAKEIECATIDFVGSNDMAASLTDIKHGIEVGCLSATGQYRPCSTFELCNLLGHSIVGRILQTGIEIALFLQIEEHRHFFRVIIFKGSTLDDWQLNRFTVFRFIASLYTDRGSF